MEGPCLGQGMRVLRWSVLRARAYAWVLGQSQPIAGDAIGWPCLGHSFERLLPVAAPPDILQPESVSWLHWPTALAVIAGTDLALSKVNRQALSP